MPWVTTNGRRYYRRSYRAGGKVVTEHVGGGMAGHLASGEDTVARLKRAEHAARTNEAVDLARVIHAADQLLTGVFAVAAVGSGFHLHRRQWRPNRRSPMPTPSPTPRAADEIVECFRFAGRPPLQRVPLSAVAPEDRDALRAAARGEPGALAAARKYLDDPAWARHWGDPVLAAKFRLLLAVSGDDPLVATAVATAARDLADELGWASAALAERMAIGRAVHNWLAVSVLEVRASDLPPEGRERVQVEKCLTQADRRLAAAMRTLAVMKRVKLAELMAKAAAAGAGVGLGGLRPPRARRAGVEDAAEAAGLGRTTVVSRPPTV